PQDVFPGKESQMGKIVDTAVPGWPGAEQPQADEGGDMPDVRDAGDHLPAFPKHRNEGGKYPAGFRKVLQYICTDNEVERREALEGLQCRRIVDAAFDN